MDLAEYDGLSEAALAKRTGLSVPTINRIKRRKRTAGLRTALSIEAATDGAVRAEDLPLTDDTRAVLSRLRLAEHRDRA